MPKDADYALLCDASTASPSCESQADRAGWVELSAFRKQTPAGLCSRVHGRNGRFVAAFRSNGELLDWDADAGSAIGLYSCQVVDALMLVAEMQADGIPLSRISFTGRSLGAGLAGALAVFFGVRAVTFAAPLERPAVDVPFLLTVTDFGLYPVAHYYEAYASHLSKLGTVQPDAGFLAYSEAWRAGRSSGRLLYQAREGLVQEIFTGEAMPELPGLRLDPCVAEPAPIAPGRHAMRLAALLTASLPAPRSDMALH